MRLDVCDPRVVVAMRKVLLGVVASAVVIGAAAASASAAVTIGAVTSGTGGSLGILDAGSTYLQTIDDPGQPSYAAPTGGVITGWRARLGAMVAATFKLTVVRPAAGGQFTVVGESPGTHAGMLSSIDDVSFPARIPVATGDRIGLMVPAGPVAGTYEVVTTGSISSIAGDPQQGPFTPTGTTAGRRLQLQATLEPDADGDGYGDETQDACPADPARQAPPCAPPPSPTSAATPTPDTTAPVLKQLVVDGRHVTFTADEAGSLTLRLTRLVDGRRRGRSCVKPTAPLRRKPHCTRRRTSVVLTRTVAAGPGSLTLSSRQVGKGRYELAIFLRDAAGNRSPALTGRLTLKP